MKTTLKTQVILVCRTEVEKTPKTVFAHEVDLLKKIHGDRKIELTDCTSPVGDVEVDLEEEYLRLMDEYAMAQNEDGHPVVNFFGDLSSFVQLFDVSESESDNASEPQKRAYKKAK